MRVMVSTILGTMNNEFATVEAQLATGLTAELSNALGAHDWSSLDVLAANGFEDQIVPSTWLDAEYREAEMEATVQNLVAWQTRVNREERSLTQSQLAKMMGTGQPAISKLEDPDGGDVMLSTLVKAAHAFQCALMVRFVDYEVFAERTRDLRSERFYAVGFEDLPSLASGSNSSKRALKKPRSPSSALK